MSLTTASGTSSTVAILERAPLVDYERHLVFLSAELLQQRIELGRLRDDRRVGGDLAGGARPGGRDCLVASLRCLEQVSRVDDLDRLLAGIGGPCERTLLRAGPS